MFYNIKIRLAGRNKAIKQRKIKRCKQRHISEEKSRLFDFWGREGEYGVCTVVVASWWWLMTQQCNSHLHAKLSHSYQADSSKFQCSNAKVSNMNCNLYSSVKCNLKCKTETEVWKLFLLIYLILLLNLNGIQDWHQFVNVLCQKLFTETFLEKFVLHTVGTAYWDHFGQWPNYNIFTQHLGGRL